MAQAKPAELRNPWVAAGLSVGVPLSFVAGGSTQNYFRSTPIPVGVLFLMAPFTIGAGHVYAGEPLKGVFIGLGTPFVALGAGYLGSLVGPMVFTNDLPGGTFTDPASRGALIGGLYAPLIYIAWASWDAYQTAERKNQEALMRPDSDR